VEFVEDLAQAGDFAAHLGDGVGPEVVGVGLLEADGRCFLQGGDGGVADARVGRRDVFDQFGGPDQVADAPAGGVEVLACAPDG